MLLALAGVTGVGKSYYVEQISKKLNFKKVNTIRTREAREGEDKKYFMTSQKLEEMYQNGMIAYKFTVFGGEYGYSKEEIFSKDNMIFEMHYTTIYDWKKISSNIKTIYILPTNIEIAKQKAKERMLPKEKEFERIKEIEEHYNRITTDKSLQSQFDYIVYNNYDEESEKLILNLVKKMINENQNYN